MHVQGEPEAADHQAGLLLWRFVIIMVNEPWTSRTL